MSKWAMVERSLRGLTVAFVKRKPRGKIDALSTYCGDNTSAHFLNPLRPWNSSHMKIISKTYRFRGSPNIRVGQSIIRFEIQENGPKK